MKDIVHKLSHDIVESAVSHKVKTIKLERLANIRSTTRTNRKNNHCLHTWSFYRLARYIEYKLNLQALKLSTEIPPTQVRPALSVVMYTMPTVGIMSVSVAPISIGICSVL
ncbi:MAG: IS200/IS605 family accessory protein TnpB-related protein [Succinivibrio sp.]|nr:IS200/IS605 family accessory protein TnpB-related protein [Succinivibrio sp.]